MFALPAFKTHWDPATYDGEFTEAEVKELARAQTSDEWKGETMAVLVVAQAVGKKGRRLIGCHCHTDIDLGAQPAATKAGRHRKRARGTEAAVAPPWSKPPRAVRMRRGMLPEPTTGDELPEAVAKALEDPVTQPGGKKRPKKK